MNAKAMCLGGSVLLVGALLLWSCAADTTGGTGSSCSSSGDCGSGLICAVGRCSDSSKGSFCDKNDQCVDELICNGATCGGADGDQCVRDGHCIPGLICASLGDDLECTPRVGRINSPCRLSAHCDAGLQCVDATCAEIVPGTLGSDCNDTDSNSRCNEGLVCINRICNNKSGEGGMCSNNDHCLDFLSLMCDDGRCRRSMGVCSVDADCADPFVCNGAPGNKVCGQPGGGSADSTCGVSSHCNDGLSCVLGMCSNGSADSVCGVNSHCNNGLSCVLGLCSDRSAGSRCLTGDDCTGSLICGNNVCGGAVGSSCSDDTDCGVDLVCNGAPGNKVCGQPGGGSADSVCGVNSHCNNGLSCVLGLCSNRSAGSTCEFDLHCADSLICGNGICGLDVRSLCSTDEACAGSLICAGPTGGILTCAQSNGLLGNACGLDAHCTGSLCLNGVCKIAELGERCNSDNAYCTDGLVCSGSGESSACRVARGGVCVADGDCVNTDVNSNVCQFGQNAQPRVCTPLDPRIGGVCRNDAQCAGDNVICINDPGRQICAEKGDGSIGSVCNRDEHCDIEDGMGGMDETPICHNYACAAVGTKWTSRVSNVSGELVDVHYGGNRWVAAGGIAGRGDITTSRDGTVWTSEITSETHRINAIHYASDRWIAVSTGGNLISSTDNGMSWGMPRTPTSESTALTAIHYNFAKWVVVGENTDGGGYIATSGNGTGWTLRESHVTSRLNAAYRADTQAGISWAAVGNGGVISTSAPQASPPLGAGNVWASQTSGVSSGLVDVYYGNSLWVAASGDGNIITSSNGTTWTAQQLTDSGIRDIHYANSLWVAVGAEIVSGINSGLVATSSDGTTWTKRTSNTSETLNAVHYDNDLWVAVGNGGVIVTSTNGTTWAAQTSNVTSDLTDIYYGNSQWVAVGTNGAITTSRTR